MERFLGLATQDLGLFGQRRGATPAFVGQGERESRARRTPRSPGQHCYQC